MADPYDPFNTARIQEQRARDRDNGPAVVLDDASLTREDSVRGTDPLSYPDEEEEKSDDDDVSLAHISPDASDDEEEKKEPESPEDTRKKNSNRLRPQFTGYKTRMKLKPEYKEIPKHQLLIYQKPESKEPESKKKLEGGLRGNMLYCDPKTRKKHYVKGVHSNEQGMMEILAAKLVGLTGIQVPHTIFGQGFGEVIDCSKRKDKETLEGRPNYFIASQALPGYYDFAALLKLVNDNPELLFPSKKEQAYKNKYKELEALRRLPNTNHAKNKILKRDCMLELLELLPTKFKGKIKDMLDEMYVISTWIGNWDMFNWDLTNMGFVVELSEDPKGKTKIKEISPAIIDFGNCLFAGFGGKHKWDSFKAANTAAKPRPNNITSGHDFDPALKKWEDFVLPGLHTFDSSPTALLGCVPRRKPFEKLFADNNLSVTRALSDSSLPCPLSPGFLRGLRRLSMIRDKDIEEVVRDWYHLGNGINHLPKDFAPQQHSLDELAATMKARRDKLCEDFRPQLHRYKIEHRKAEGNGSVYGMW